MEKEFSAKLLEDAKAQAYAEYEALGASRGDITFEVVEQPVKKLFGLKGEYKVKASWNAPEAAPAEKPAEAAAKTASPEASSEAKADVDCEKVKRAVAYLTKLIGMLGVEEFEIVPTPKDDLVVLDVQGKNLGVIIGRRGETLDALQYLTILASNRGEENYCRISVDCCGYREKRREALEVLASKTAHKVLKTGRRVTLEPMNPYERRIIHSKVAEIEGVSSHSTGDEPYRKVVISSISGKREDGTTPVRRDDNRRGGDRRPQRSGNAGAGGNGIRTYKQSSAFSTSFEREYKRAPSAPVEYSQETVEVEKETELYGKIEL